eukprot:5841599-Lingulodinium_polyedra.AAC.1
MTAAYGWRARVRSVIPVGIVRGARAAVVDLCEDWCLHGCLLFAKRAIHSSALPCAARASY